MELVGYLYIRINNLTEKYNACKFGKVRNGENPINRFQCYKTYEIEPGTIILLIETTENVDVLENDLKLYFTSLDLQVYYEGGGTEYFSKEIIEKIIPILQLNKLNYRVCSKEEIESMKPKEQSRKEIKSKESMKLIKNYCFPKEHQIEILEKSKDFFINNNIGRLNWSCGLGKSLMSLFIVKELKCKTVIIGVPSKNLQSQFKDEILRIFPNKNNILFIGSIQDDAVKTTKDVNEIKSFLDESEECKFIVTTYHSCNFLLTLDYFDFKIGDEAHHLTGKIKESDANFLLFHQIRSRKSLFMTATEKIIDVEQITGIYSMDDETKFGKIIDSKSVKWAIENKKITDYALIIIKNREEDFKNIIDKLSVKNINVELLISAYITLKSIEKFNDLTHMLIYTNSIGNAQIVNEYISLLLEKNMFNFSKEDFYNNALSSRNAGGLFDKNENIGEITKFRLSKYGIISCVYLFGEGFNEPKLNGVTFADKMESDIRITQYSLRPNRLEKGNENKKAYNIIPYIEPSSNNSFEKCRTIISKLRIMDENIESKMKLLSINSGSSNPENPDLISVELNENYDELTKLKIRLRHANALQSFFGQKKDEYNYVQMLNKEMNIQSKEEYNRCRETHENYIDEPEVYFNGIWDNWLDFLGIDTSVFFKTKDEWNNFCRSKNISSLEEYKNACELYKELPKNPADFYLNFTNILYELGFFIGRRR